MVLQRAPQQAVVWGFGEPGSNITTKFGSASMSAVVGADGIWRQALPATEATATPMSISFSDGKGTTRSLDSVCTCD